MMIPPKSKSFTLASMILIKDLFEESGSPRDFHFFCTLPSHVLGLLAKATQQEIAGEELNRISAFAERAFKRLLQGGISDPSILGRAQIWVYRSQLAYTSPRRLLRLGRSLFGDWKAWKKIDSCEQSLQDISSSLDVLRDPAKFTQDRCDSITKLADILGQTPCWQQIENILYQNQFCWPLLIIRPLQQGRYGRTMAVSLPVAVDVSWNSLDEVKIIARNADLINTWEANARKCVRVAKTLWKATHQHYDTFRDLVEEASVIFDFRIAEKIIDDLAKLLGEQISLSDQSADAYFAQVVLNRLLGRRSPMATAITGGIGLQIQDEYGVMQPNYIFEDPKRIMEQIEFASATRIYSQFVFPVVESSRGTVNKYLLEVNAPSKDEKGSDQTDVFPGLESFAETVYATDMLSVADNVQSHGWRQQQYIRCPEIRWSIHGNGKPGLLHHSQSMKVQNVIDRLRSNNDSVLTLDESPIVVASALCHIDSQLRLEKFRADCQPIISWAFIRPLDNEQDLWFWNLLLQVIGATSDELFDFLRHADRKEAVDRLTILLNKAAPDVDQPAHRCPNIIVIVGSQIFDESKNRTPNPSARPFMVSAIIDELRNRLVPLGNREELVFKFIGHTRIILIPKDSMEDSGTRDTCLDDFSKEEQRALRYLSAKKGGFTKQTASLMLFGLGNHFEVFRMSDILESLMCKGAVRYCQGEYHVSQNFAATLQCGEAPEDAWEKHYRAGCALAPYAVGGGFPLLDLDSSISPEQVHEAEWHFDQARYCATLVKEQEAALMYEVTNKALMSLNRYVIVPSWANVSKLLRGGSPLQSVAATEPYELSCELLRWNQISGILAHPSHLVTAAEAVSKAATYFHINLDDPACSLYLHRKAKQLYLQSLANCAGFPQDEEAVNRVICLTRYVSYLCEPYWILLENLTKQEREELEQDIEILSRQIEELLRAGADRRMATARWFELMADRERDHFKSLILYKRGIDVHPDRASLWLKHWGAASLSGLFDKVDEMLHDLPIAVKTIGIYRVAHKFECQELRLSRHEIERIREGVKVFESLFGNDSIIKRIKSAVLRNLETWGDGQLKKHSERETNIQGHYNSTYLQGALHVVEEKEAQGIVRCSKGGERSYFGAFDLRGDLSAAEVLNGKGEGTNTSAAINVRGQSNLLLKGTISVIMKNYGFICTPEGKEYYFNQHDLSGGLKLENIAEGSEVHFQMRKEPDNPNVAGTAKNVRCLADLSKRARS